MTNIVMLCQNRLRLLTQALRSLSDHTDPREFTLTLVDDGSTDFRVKKLLRECDRAHVSLLEVSNSDHVLGKLKNLGVEWSKKRFGTGDWLYLSDSDVWFDKDWLPKMISMAEFLEPSRYRLFGGQVHPFHQPIGDPVGDKPWIAYWMDGGEHAEVKWQEHNILDGPSWLMRWQTWGQYGPLPESCAPGVCQSEEYPFCQRLLEDKMRIAVVKPHVVEHTGITQTDGKLAPGAEVRLAQKREGTIYE